MEKTSKGPLKIKLLEEDIQENYWDPVKREVGLSPYDRVIDEVEDIRIVGHEIGHGVLGHLNDNVQRAEFEAELWYLSRTGEFYPGFADTIAVVAYELGGRRGSTLRNFSKAIDNVNKKRLPTSYELPKEELVEWFKLFLSDLD